MLELLFLAAAAQVQVVRMPPVIQVAPEPSAPSSEAVPAPVEVALPDLKIAAMRLIGDQIAEFEVKNQGRATASNIRMYGCASTGDPNRGISDSFCSAKQVVGTLAAGRSKWVRIECFLDKGGIDSGGSGGLFGSVPSTITVIPPRCTDLLAGRWPIIEFSAFVDPAADSLRSDRIAAPAMLQPDCGDDFGCVREINESNNRATFKPPFPK